MTKNSTNAGVLNVHLHRVAEIPSLHILRQGPNQDQWGANHLERRLHDLNIPVLSDSSPHPNHGLNHNRHHNLKGLCSLHLLLRVRERLNSLLWPLGSPWR